MNVLCLDLGQHCGWAMSVNGKIQSGVWNLKPTKFESNGFEFVKFKRNLELEIIIGGVEKIYFEAVRRHSGTDAAHCYGGYLNILRCICLENDIPYEGIPVQTIKKHATGSGNADKGKMIEVAIKKFPRTNVIDDNHADALLLLNYILTTY